MGPSQVQGQMTHPQDWPSAECAVLQEYRDILSTGELLTSPGQAEKHEQEVLSEAKECQYARYSEGIASMHGLLTCCRELSEGFISGDVLNIGHRCMPCVLDADRLTLTASSHRKPKVLPVSEHLAS